jgi:ADP-glucose type glycogen/starch synthase
MSTATHGLAAGGRNPRILVVTPEITYLPQGMGNLANNLTAKAGGLADVSAALVSALFELGADVHVALPHYRRMFHIEIGNLIGEELRVYQSKLPGDRIHLAEDRIFFYRDAVYASSDQENPKIALAFQREVINNIIPRVNPDLIHCNDWMTGLIPAMARRINIPCLFTVHNIHTWELTLAQIEDRGIDAAGFWRHLYYKAFPTTYEQMRGTHLVDMLASGLFAAHYINTVSPTFLEEIVARRHPFVPEHLRAEFANKVQAGCAAGILNAPDPKFTPATDAALERRYTPDDAPEARRVNKLEFQRRLGLNPDADAPIFFWPSRLDPAQKGCQLLAHILYDVVSSYWADNLQVAIVANGAYQGVFRDIVRQHDFYGRVAVCDFNDDLSHLGYAGSDFMLMPSLFEPCGLPQMISAIYGTLSVVRDTGGLHDTIFPLDVEAGTGNGIVFETYDAGGLRWAMDQAMAFHRLPREIKDRETRRMMREGAASFNHAVNARSYFDIYEKMLRRPIINTF